MSNDLADDFSDFVNPADSVKSHTIQDRFPDPQPAFRCGIVGIGQCGNNLAAAFHKVGYDRVLALNTAVSDLESVTEPICKLALDRQGAGKDRDLGRRRAVEKAPQIRSAMAQVFGDDVEKIIVCMSLGGGTGSGGGPEVVRLAKEFTQERGLNPDRDVIVFAVLPEPIACGPRQCFNALKAYARLERLGGPQLYIDNAQLQKIIRATLGANWVPINKWVVKTFHRFNAFATRTSEQCVCDGRDLSDVLARGRLIFSAFKIETLDDKHAIGGIMADHLENSLFAKTNLATSEAAACLIILNRSTVLDCAMGDITPAFTELNAMMKPSSTLHTGVYLEDLHPSAQGTPPPDLFCYVMLGGLDHPTETLNGIYEQARRYDPGYGSLSAFLDENESSCSAAR